MHSQWRTVFVFHKAVGKKNGGPKANPPTTLLQRATQPNARALELKSARADRVSRTLKLRSNPSASLRPEKAVGGARARAPGGMIIEWLGQAERPGAAPLPVAPHYFGSCRVRSFHGD